MSTPPESNLIQPPATSSPETAPVGSVRDLLRSRPDRRSAASSIGPLITPTDGELLMLFTKHQDEEALTRIIERHGPMVWRVCRGVLLHQQDAEDSYQATFLILARNARSIRAGESIAGWLYRVAHRTAISARRRSLKRREERLATEPPAPPEKEFPDLIGRQMVGLLLEELHRLPAKYQTPLVMRYLEGRSRRAIAEATDTTIATVQGQLARGKKLLRSRLVRRGVSLSAAMLIVSGAARTEAAPVHLITQTTADMSALALGSGSLAASATVLTLYREGARLMFFASLTKPALATTGVLLMALLATPLLADGNEGTAPVPVAAAPTLLLDATVTEPEIESPLAMPLLIAQAYGAGEETGATAGLPSSAAAEANPQPEFNLEFVPEEPLNFESLFSEFNRTFKQIRKQSSQAQQIDAMLRHLPEDSQQRKELQVATLQMRKEVDQWITLQAPGLIPQLIQAATQADSEKADEPEGRSRGTRMGGMGMGGMGMGGAPTTCLARLGNSLDQYGQFKEQLQGRSLHKQRREGYRNTRGRGGLRALGPFAESPVLAFGDKIDVSIWDGSTAIGLSGGGKITHNGILDIGKEYGKIEGVGGKTLAEAQKIVAEHVRRVSGDPTVRVRLMHDKFGTAGGQAPSGETTTSAPLLDKPAVPPSGMDPFGDYGGETSSTSYDARDSLSNHADQPFWQAVQPAVQNASRTGHYSAKNQPLHDLLRRPLTDEGLVFADTPLKEAVDFISDKYGIETALHVTGLDNLGIGPDEPVTCNLRHVSLGTALDLMLEPIECQAIVRNGVLLVTSNEEAAVMLETVIYPVGDLLAADPAMKVHLIETIIVTVAADTWAENGNGSDLRILPVGKLVVSQSQRNHKKVAAFLNQLRGAALGATATPAPLLDKPAVPPSISPSSNAHGIGRWRVIHRPSNLNPDGWATIAEVKMGYTAPIMLTDDQRPRPHLRFVENGKAGCSFRVEHPLGTPGKKLYTLHVNVPRIDEIAGQKVQIIWLAGSRDTHALLLIRQVTGAGFGSTPNNLEKMVRHLLDNPNEPDPAPLPPNYNLVPGEITSEDKEE